MAQYNRPPKVKAKKSDEFISFFDHLIRYFFLHQNKFWFLVLIGVLSLGAYGIYRYQVSRKFSTLSMEYFEAEKAPEADALNAWEKLKAKNPPASLARVIELQMSSIYANKDWNEAAKWLQPSTEKKGFLLRGIANLAYATSLENAQDFQRALQIYREIFEDKNNPYHAEARLGMARCFIQTQKTEEGRKILNELVGRLSTASEGVKLSAQTSLLALELRGSQLN